ncbi:hypothetical protein G5I_13105 [Acromyrmex echinatior]|uniref:Uncharacterized protein n=1 Tax=Acromyrmex echinatior TaxID=103372 RepID=F4X448_ACREC|nr:hypothetical protein G5I_13105 [Acromyrmex echinatior]
MVGVYETQVEFSDKGLTEKKDRTSSAKTHKGHYALFWDINSGPAEVQGVNTEIRLPLFTSVSENPLTGYCDCPRFSVDSGPPRSLPPIYLPEISRIKQLNSMSAIPFGYPHISSPGSKGLSSLTQKVGSTFALSVETDVIASLQDVDPYSGTEKEALKMKEKILAVAESTKIPEDINDESISYQDPVKLLYDLMDSKISIQSTQCLKPVSIDLHINVQKCEDDNTLVIESTGHVDTDHIQQEHESEGNRIMDFAFFNKELHRVFDNHSQYHCCFEDWKFVDTRRIGFKTQFFYECKFCFHKADFWSHPTGSTNMDLNMAITARTITIRIDYTQMKERMVVGQRGHIAKIVPMIHFPELELLLVIAQRKFSLLAFATSFVRREDLPMLCTTTEKREKTFGCVSREWAAQWAAGMEGPILLYWGI